MVWKQQWLWWKRGIIYQIYPRSFQDSNDDGCGDLNGILQQLDYLEWLGVHALWISPIFPSPMKDFGYDIADYTAIHPLFGTMDDFDRLLAETHRRGMKLLLDLVSNHSSDQHPWFIESASSRDNPKRDWYLWADPAPDGGPPNNWVSEFAGSAWQWHEATGQYYYHAFLAEQPDLNWRNPAVHEAIHAAMRFWLDKGVDGFRVDVMWHMIKDEHLRHNPPNPDYDPATMSPYEEFLPVFSTDQPEVHDVVRGMRRVIDEYDERLLIGEIYLPIEHLISYYGSEQDEAHLPFNFQLIGAPWDAAHIRSVIDTYEASLPPDGWPNWVLGNHDKSRLGTRVGSPQARVAAMLLLTLRGTPTLYYGDEIGMRDVDVPPEQRVDPRELNCPGRGLGRDMARSPMQWDASDNAGFSRARPWLPLSPDYRECNVASERSDPRSLPNLYRRLIGLRRQEPALAIGDYEPLPVRPPLLGYIRQHGDQALIVMLNFSNGAHEFILDLNCVPTEILISTHDPAARPASRQLELRPNEGVIVRLQKPPHHPCLAHPVDPNG